MKKSILWSALAVVTGVAAYLVIRNRNRRMSQEEQNQPRKSRHVTDVFAKAKAHAGHDGEHQPA